MAVADMCQADGAPGKEVRETRKRQQPVEDWSSLGGQIDVGKETKEEREDQRNPWATVLVDLGKDFWCHAIER
jgi:hypothetical protein